MSRIFPASGLTVDWSPDLEKEELKKQAMSEDGKIDVEVSEPDPLLDAIKDLPSMGVSDEVEVVEDGAEVIDDAEIVGEGADVAEDVAEDSAAGEAVEKIEEAKEALDDAEQAIGQIEEIHEDEAAEEDEVVDVTDEVVVEDAPESCEKCGISPCECEDPSGEDMEKEGLEDRGCTAKEETEIEIEAEVEEEKDEKKDDEDEEKEEDLEKEASYDFGNFIHLAKLSPENRKDLVKYWKNMLGFPPEYVAAMTKDYED